MVATPGYGVFPPEPQGGVPPSPIVCNGYMPLNTITGFGPFYIAPDCTTTLTDCQMNALSSEILAAVDLLGYPYNSNFVDNLGRALVDRFDLQQVDIDSRVKRSGDTMEGMLTLWGPPVNDNDAATKLYVDETAQAAADACCEHMQNQLDNAEAGLQTQINNRVRRDGDQMTGPLILSGDPTTAMQAATMQYVISMSSRVIIAPEPPTGQPDGRLWWNSTNGALYVNYEDPSGSLQWVQACGACDIGDGDTSGGPGTPDLSLYLPLTGGTLSGRLFLVGTPTLPNEAATKHYVDEQIAAGGTFVDAPADGRLWARKNSMWELVPPSLDDAPEDGEMYARQDNQWVQIPGIGDIDGGTF